MRTVGAYEAKTHLPRLLDDVARGEIITITKHGVPVARLVPPGEVRPPDVGAAITGLRALRRQIAPLKDETTRDLIEEGQRY